MFLPSSPFCPGIRRRRMEEYERAVVLWQSRQVRSAADIGLRRDSPKERRLLFNLAGELAECQNLADWLKETPREAQ